ncbi:hypothetical protein SEVIR_8G201600v4 [Setaria viridis]|uniref:Cyclin-dependent kinase inhibitor domain-containing protein n=1 Tax=Setaria viridis TaxID=4556 RepID=A0A4U6TL47_SETVI|nr:cyclin-dependent kinase inhibitor 3-like [Setaria viridis]TKW01785.1 hypothetical protein SEVIR_8G201600v2 [Setaria viridis]
MGKCVRIRSSSSKQNPSPSTGEAAAACLTLRSGRRVPVAASCSPPGSSRHRRGGAAPACRRCGAKRACDSPGRRKCSQPRPHRGRAALASAELRLSGGRPEEEPLPSSQANPAARDVDGDRGDSAPATPLSGDEVMKSKHEHGSKGGVPGQPSPSPSSPLLQAEMEAFFVAAELAERRRFAEAYNYDVALDRPLEGRFEWAPVST